MKNMFPGYFSNDDKTIKDIWESCIFVLDANVLLSLYRYSGETRSELFEVFKLLNDRLWVPHQVASEYLGNRIGVIAQQVKVYDEAIKTVEELRRSLENQKQHPFVAAETLSGSLVLFGKIISDLAENKNIFLSKIEFDDIKSQLEVLLDGCVGAGLTVDEVSDVLSAGALRYAQKIPPGYKDVKKGGDSAVVADKLKPFGDYIVWRQTLAKAKADGLPVIFVTGDSKEDWWTIYSGRPLEPHPQLVDEFVREVGQDFFMYLPEDFMRRANEYLNRATSQSAVDEIIDIRAEEMAEVVVSKEIVSGGDRRGKNFVNISEMNSLVAERDALEKKLIGMQPLMEGVQVKIETIEFERIGTLTRYKMSLKGSGGEETVHSERLMETVGIMDVHLELLKLELEALKKSYNDLLSRLSGIKWEMDAVVLHGGIL